MKKLERITCFMPTADRLKNRSSASFKRMADCFKGVKPVEFKRSVAGGKGAGHFGSWRRRRTFSMIMVFLLFTFSVLGMAGCGSPEVTKEALSADDDTQIVLHGLSGEDISVSVAELKELDSVTKKAEATRSNGEHLSVKATGPLLQTLVAKYGADLEDYSTVRFHAGDGYSIAMPSNIIQNDDIILSYYDNGVPHTAENGPVRVVVPGERAMYWVRMLTQIDFETEASAQTPEHLVFLDAALPQLEVQNVERADSQFDAVTATFIMLVT